jgi:hypothetical protein
MRVVLFVLFAFAAIPAFAARQIARSFGGETLGLGVM